MCVKGAERAEQQVEATGAMPVRSGTSRPPEQGGAGAAPPEAHPDDGEIGGPKGLEPTRFGDWERKGRCIDF